MTNSKSKVLSQIRDSVRKLYEANQEAKRVNEYVQQVRKKEYLCISNFMYSNFPNGVDSFDIELDEGYTYYQNPIKLRVTKIRNKKIKWDFKKLRDVFPKEVFNKMVLKTYTVNDMDGLIRYLKKCGVDPKKFKKFIDVSYLENDAAIEQMHSTGEIKSEQLNGCYTVEMGDPYIRLTEIK